MILVLYTFFSERIDDDTAFENLLPSLPENLREMTKRYKRRENHWASLLGKLLIQRGFTELGIRHSLADLQYSAYNRPFIGGTTLDFNIAHSGHCVVCAMSSVSFFLTTLGNHERDCEKK